MIARRSLGLAAAGLLLARPGLAQAAWTREAFLEAMRAGNRPAEISQEGLGWGIFNIAPYASLPHSKDTAKPEKAIIEWRKPGASGEPKT